MGYYDLCTDCIYSHWFWIPVSKQYGYRSYIIRYELGKRCKIRGKRGLRYCFRASYIMATFIDRVVTKCNKFMNSTLTGFVPNPNNFRKVKDNMPKLAVNLAERNEPEEGKTYGIEDSSMEITEISKYKGLRINFSEVNSKLEPIPDPEKKDKFLKASTMCWITTENVGKKSKLGSFLNAFMEHFKGTDQEDDFNNSDNWKGHFVKIVSWKDKNREVIVIK